MCPKISHFHTTRNTQGREFYTAFLFYILTVEESHNVIAIAHLTIPYLAVSIFSNLYTRAISCCRYIVTQRLSYKLILIEFQQFFVLVETYIVGSSCCTIKTLAITILTRLITNSIILISYGNRTTSHKLQSDTRLTLIIRIETTHELEVSIGNNLATTSNIRPISKAIKLVVGCRPLIYLNILRTAPTA